MASGAYSPEMIGAVFVRTSCLLSLVHAKKLLLVHGYQSFYEYITNFLDLNSSKLKTNKGLANLIKAIRKSDHFEAFNNYLEESKSVKNHPKLRKLVDILTSYFSDENHK